MRFIADLHIHSRYSRATSGDCTPEELHRWAAYKGLTLVGTGDFTHPGWREELRQKLEPAPDGYGTYKLKDEFLDAAGRRAADGIPWLGGAQVRFVLAGEISTIYKKAGRTRKIHHLILLPSFEAADALSSRLEQVGNIHSDGRPILGLDSRILLEMTLEACPEALFIPAHIWTPHFSLFGANSGFDAIEECFDDLTGHIYAVETGLSSDPPMNWRFSALDRFALVSNSDAHSPANLAREANIFDTGLSFDAIREALRDRDPARFIGTLEFFPEEGKYHYDGHRGCGVRWKPSQTRAAGGICPACGRGVTVGVLHRVEELADRPEGAPPPAARHFESLVPLGQVIASAIGVGESSKQVREQYLALIRALGPELTVLRESSIEDVRSIAGPAVAEAIRRVRAGEVEIKPGFDGEYGSIVIMREEDRRRLQGQGSLFGFLPSSSPSGSFLAESGFLAEPAATTASAAPAIAATRASAIADAPATAGATDAVDAAATLDASARIAAHAPAPTTAPAPSHEALVGAAAGLNRDQREVVTAGSGPIIVIAGPGTGKTRTLAHRIVYLIKERGVDPGQITAVTFTNKAAGEMRTRVRDIVNSININNGHRIDGVGPGNSMDGLEAITIGTFHSICLDMLKASTGRTGPLVILDEFDSRAVIEETLREYGTGRRINAREAQRYISLLKGRGIGPSDAAALAPGGEISQVYQAYQERLARYMALDYDDILLEAVRLLRQGGRETGLAGASLPEGWLDRFTHLLVDEFQDVNPIQYELVKLWAGDGTRLFVIGDPDQAIYGFRGSDHRFFDRLKEDFPGSSVYRLRVNYRSTSQILRAASAVIAHNRDCAGFELESARGDGPRIRHIEVPGEIAEGIAIVREIGRMVGGATMLQAHGQGGGRQGEARGEFRDEAGPERLAAGLPDSGNAGPGAGAGDVSRSFSDIAVLFRTGRQGEVLEECFLKEGIPYRIVGRESFLEDRGVRAALAFLKCIVNPGDEFHLSRCLAALASGRKTGMKGGGDPGELRARLQERLEAYRSLSMSEPPGQVLERWIAEEEGREEGVQDGAGARVSEALKRLMRVASRFESLESFISGINLAREADHERPGGNVNIVNMMTVPEAVTLMTLHAAKGLEFPVVFIAGVEEGILPFRGSAEASASYTDETNVKNGPGTGRRDAPGDDAPGDLDVLEDVSEERRLFYVGMTRAVDELILLSARKRARPGTSGQAPPSRFLSEIPPDYIQREVRLVGPRGNRKNRGNRDGGASGTQLSLFAD
ncbi:MAG: UvrD-helicase domain-containing protein [Firmicutes bacterium]|nr:UvrD-helicase domain-containing protein [Bacillota bacterium]